MPEPTVARHPTTLFTPPVRRNMLSATGESESEQAVVVEPFTVHALTGDERRDAESAAATATALALKGLLHRLDPHTYLAPTQADAPEALAIATVREIEERAFTRLAPKLRALAADDTRLARLLAPLGPAIDLRGASIGILRSPKMFNGQMPKRVTVTPSEPDAPSGPVVVRDGPAARFTRMDLVLRSVHCVDEANVARGADHMVLGGVLIGASGVTRVMPSRFLGRFQDDTHVSLGDSPFGQFSLRSTPEFPKVMHAVLQLVESDQDEATAARELTRAMSSISTVAVSALSSSATGAIAGALLGTLGAVGELFVSDAAFAPYGLRIRLEDELAFGPQGDSGPLRTGHIVGHGGAYRIGFRWVLNA